MGNVRVKICSLTRSEDVSDAVDSGADAVGFIFGYGSSPRNLSYERLAALVEEVPPYVSSVVVSAASNSDLARVIREIRPSFLQLSYDGNGSPSKDSELHRNSAAGIISTVNISSNESGDSVIERCKVLSGTCRGILLDSALMKPKKHPLDKDEIARPGGAGVSHDWNLSRFVRDALYPFPVILGGGLTERNVQEAINIVRPFAVDVSSGVESEPGIKDRAKIRGFIQRAKSDSYLGER